MTRAEQRALETYPYSPTEVNLFGHKTITADGNSCDRAKYLKGYEQAEKDLALTWEDIAKIDALILDINNEMAIDYSQEISRQKFYEEVLRRFNEAKK